MPWVTIESKQIVVTGFNTEGTNFGKPAIFHLFLLFIFLVLVLLGKNWSYRAAFFTGAFNIAWAVRNFIVISACHGGICPEKHIGLYLILFLSVIVTISSLFIPVSEQIPPDLQEGT